MTNARVWLAVVLGICACTPSDGSSELPTEGPRDGEQRSGMDLAGGQSGTDSGSQGSCVLDMAREEHVALDALPRDGTRTPNQVFPAFEGTRTYRCGDDPGSSDAGLPDQRLELGIRRGTAARTLVGQRRQAFWGPNGYDVRMGGECQELVLDAEVTLRLNGETILQASKVLADRFSSYSAFEPTGSVQLDGRSYAIWELTLRGTDLVVRSEHPSLFRGCREVVPTGPFDRCAADTECTTSDLDREIRGLEDCSCRSFCSEWAVTTATEQRRKTQYDALCWSNREAFDPSSCEVGPCSQYARAVCRDGVCTLTTDRPPDGGTP